MKLFLKWTISLLIAALFVWLASRQWPLDRVLCSSVEMSGGTLTCLEREADGTDAVSWVLHILWLIPAFLVLVAVHFLGVLRWGPLIRPLAQFDFWTLNRVGAVSFLALFIFPLRLGELARPYLVAHTGKLRKSAVLGTIAVERVMDGLMMALLLAGVLFFLPGGDTMTYISLRAGALVALTAFAGAMVMLVVAWLSKDFAVRVVHKVFGIFSSRLAERLAGMMGAFIDGLKAMPDLKNFLQFVGLTAVYWGINGFYFYFVLMAFDLNTYIDLVGAYAMMSAVAVGMMIPNSPANVGSFWYFLLLPAALYGVPVDSGAPMAFALMVWGMMLLQYAVFAGYYFVACQMSMGSLWSIQKQKLGSETENSK